MAAKQIQYDTKGRQALLAGVAALSKAVKTTLGPKGRNVIIDKKFGSPLITKDGVTVAKEIELQDPFENMGICGVPLWTVREFSVQMAKDVVMALSVLQRIRCVEFAQKAGIFRNFLSGAL